nr:MAG TPA: hypothetical protein [Bacteriophage sp.]
MATLLIFSPCTIYSIASLCLSVKAILYLPPFYQQSNTLYITFSMISFIILKALMYSTKSIYIVDFINTFTTISLLATRIEKVTITIIPLIIFATQ